LFPKRGVVAESGGTIAAAFVTKNELEVLTVESKAATLESKVVTVDSKSMTAESKIMTLDSKVVTVEPKVKTLKSFGIPNKGEKYGKEQ
jgi:hypothetical protein